MRLPFAAGFVVGTLAVVGCGSGDTGTLTGAVTVDGAPLKRGTVSLQPEGGKGSPAGGPVEDGRYRVTGLKPGKYRLRVDGEAASGPVSQEEVMKRSEKEHRAATANPVPPDATGNDVVIDVAAGDQTRDVPLKSKGK